MKELKKFIYINLIIMSVYAVLYCTLFVFIIYFYETDINLFPVQYFQDTGPLTNNLIDAAYSIFSEIVWSPHASLLVNYIVSFSAVFIVIYLFIYSVYFFVKHRKNIVIWKRLLIFPVFIVFLILFLFIFALLPAYTSIYIVLNNASRQLKSELITGNTTSFVHDPGEITSYINKSTIPVNIISGYGRYNVAVKNLTENPSNHKMNYYKLLFIPTVARYLADIKERDVDISFDYPLYYFPETNQLVVNNLSQIHDFNKSLSKDLITDLNYPQLTATLNKKGNLSEYKIVSPTEYAKYLIKTVVDKNNQSIKSDMALYQSNLNIISECRTIEMENKKLVDGQTNDYQNNCVQSRLYSNCNQLKDRIAENIKISETTSALCRKNESLVKQYNTEILKNIEIFKNNIEEVNKKGTLERNKAELGAAIFMPPNSIYFKDDKLVYSLVYNSVHEFLHYIVSSKDRDLSPYIDEAMTDYLTFKALGYDKYLSVAISGYYTEQQILLSLLEKIPFDEMLNVYISGQDKKFQEIFSKYYPETSYIEFSKIGKNIYETTYEVDGKKRNFNPMSTHSYMYSKDVEKARALLGLEKSISYSALEDLF